MFEVRENEQMNMRTGLRAWAQKIWDFVFHESLALVLMFLRLIPALLVIEAIAFVVAVASTWVRSAVLGPVPANYLATLFDELAKWSWTSGLLGTFAIWISERVKSRDKLDAIRQQTIEAFEQKDWERFEDYLDRYKTLTNSSPQTVDRDLEGIFGASYYDRASQIERDEDWEKAPGWLDQAIHYSSSHSADSKILKDLVIKQTWLFEESEIHLLESIQGITSRSLLVRLAKRIGKPPSDSNQKDRLLSLIRSKATNDADSRNQTYLLNLFGYLDVSAVVSVTPPEWFEKQGFDLVKASSALLGRAEDEPDDVFPGFYVEGWTRVASSHAIEVITQAEQAVIVGDEGFGKTMLYRMLKKECRYPMSLCVEWKSAVRLIEEREKLSPSTVIASLINDVKTTLEQDEGWRELARQVDMGLESERKESAWPQDLDLLKKTLQRGNVGIVFVVLDGLNHYPETWRFPERVRDLLTALLRPEVLATNQPWFLKLFVSNRLKEQIETALAGSIALNQVRIEWKAADLKSALAARLRAMQKEGQSLAQTSLSEFADPRLEDLIITESKSPRDLIRRLRSLMMYRADKWKSSAYRDEELDIQLDDWNFVKQPDRQV